MLHGALIYPEQPEEAFIAALHTIRHVKWEAILAAKSGQLIKDPGRMLPAHCNMVSILDPVYTSFGFLEGLVRKGCHLFLTEKQKMTSGERFKLTALAEEGNTFIQIRNDLLFHPFLLTEGKSRQESKLVEIHQTAPGRPGALQDMLYNNLLLILRIIDSDPSHTSVCAIPNAGSQPDVVNLHLNFHNGSAASLTLSFNGKRKEHRMLVHDAGGEGKYHFGEEYQSETDLQPTSTYHQSTDNSILLKQIAYFSDSILKKRCQRFGFNDEAKTYRLLERINQKLEFSMESA